ncbi:MAG: glycine zipper 2TM domain-containing protein [Desulfuromonadales bacterium]|jgi:outer membrane lipoprotein SlyB
MTYRQLSKSLLVALFCLALGTLTACMPESRSGDVYSRDQARTSQSVYYGTLLRVEEVMIEGTQSGAGTIAGGVMGGVLGSAIGGGSGQRIATAGGAVLGGMAGSAIEKNATSAVGVELEVELDNGELLVVVQEKDSVYRVGDRVRVLRDGRGTTRVRQ